MVKDSGSIRFSLAFPAFGLTLFALPAEAVNVRLKAFRDLEHVRATSGAITLICAIERREGFVAEHVCRSNGEAVDPPAVAGRNFHIVVRPALFASNPDEVVIEWVHYWR
jgi:hypothetical protein